MSGCFSGLFPRNGNLIFDERWSENSNQGDQSFCLHNRLPVDALSVGEVGYVVTGIRISAEIKIGDDLSSLPMMLRKKCFPDTRKSDPAIQWPVTHWTHPIMKKLQHEKVGKLV